MRWLTFILGALVVLTLQSVIAPRLDLWGMRPDWLLVYVMFFALYGRRLHAVVGAWGVGAAADLMTVERPVQSLTYALAALLIVGVRAYVFRYQAATQAVLAFFVGLAVRGAWLAYRAVMYPGLSVSTRVVLVEVVAAALFTALFAPAAYYFLLKAPQVFGLPRRHYGYSGGGVE